VHSRRADLTDPTDLTIGPRPRISDRPARLARWMLADEEDSVHGAIVRDGENDKVELSA
jgi:hypothetical protein